MRCCAEVTLFPEAPTEKREFATLKEAQTWAFHKRRELRGNFYTITICPIGRPGTQLEILIGKVYRGVYGTD